MTTMVGEVGVVVVVVGGVDQASFGVCGGGKDFGLDVYLENGV